MTKDEQTLRSGEDDAERQRKLLTVPVSLVMSPIYLAVALTWMRAITCEPAIKEVEKLVAEYERNQ